MIKVTDEMVQLITDWFEDTDSGRADLNNAIRAIIELHEQGKPKTEPYGYVMADGRNPDDLWLTETLSSAAKTSGRWKPLYTTPPTREPLSNLTVATMLEQFAIDDSITLTDLIRFVEKAHGIGVKP